MARFRLRRNSQTGTAPANGVLLEGEVALNTLDGRLFYGRPDGTTGLLKPLMADLATGTPSSNTYLNGAGVWSVPLNAVAPPPTGVLLPLYLFPTAVYTNATYNALEALIKRYRTVPIYVVLNPSNGLGTVTATDANYTAAIKRLRGAGAKVLGYLDSATGANTSAQILAQAATYNSFYPTAPMDGFFIDRLTNTDTQPPVDLLSATTLALHNQGFYPIIGNAGSALPERYFLNPAADSLIIHENNFYPTQATLQGDFGGGNADYDPRKRAALVYGQAFNAANVEIMRQFAGLIYTTQTVTPNQYAVPSADLELLLQTVLAAQASGLERKLDPTNSGVIAPAILGTGTPTVSTFLNGAGAWTNTLTGILNIDGGNQPFNLRAGSADYVYMGFYTRSASPTVRSAYFGFGGVASVTLTLANEIGDLSLTGTALKFNSNIVWHAGNLTPGATTPVRTVTANYTVLLSDATIFVDATAGPITVTLPAAASAIVNGQGQWVRVKKIDTTANAVTIVATGGLIDLAANAVISGSNNAFEFIPIPSTANWGGF